MISAQSNRLFRNVLNVLPELLRFFFVQDDRSIIRRPRHKNLYGYRVMPDLHFTMRDAVKVQRAISDPEKMHTAAPFTPYHRNPRL